MNQPIDLNELKRIKENLRQQPQTLDELWFSYPEFWQTLAWSKVQLSLWLTCQPDIFKDDSKEGITTYINRQQNKNFKENLSEEIIKILKIEQRPLPLTFIKNKLPKELIVTETMMKSTIEDHPYLSMIGPLVKFDKKN
ncbi:hypothetical protein BN59_00984 [Legionella massiliensis]|uniref:Uncharacterized protein n=1 Tax=Legionella massiliensis TaxID=1034943 RepID=A0A078KQN2_9GAMM|nr:hypothetical protein [Legionella massiliensis]CDZ76710.1 hypothetical protein BN59_00984 [Legionella massiliensis]CEE12448.1 hypothetical protein BN1094_00984 [Legionella massiliensis]